MSDEEADRLEAMFEDYEFKYYAEWYLSDGQVGYDEETLVASIRARRLYACNPVYVWVALDHRTDKKRVLYVGKAKTIGGRLDAHLGEFNKTPFSGRALDLRNLLETRASRRHIRLRSRTNVRYSSKCR